MMRRIRSSAAGEIDVPERQSAQERPSDPGVKGHEGDVASAVHADVHDRTGAVDGQEREAKRRRHHRVVGLVIEGQQDPRQQIEDVLIGDVVRLAMASMTSTTAVAGVDPSVRSPAAW